MQFLDSYCGKVYYICFSLSSGSTPSELKRTIKKDAFKCAIIGSMFFTFSRFIAYKRYYLSKNYIFSAILGSFFGIGYSPVFLGPKIDQYRLELLLQENQ